MRGHSGAELRCLKSCWVAHRGMQPCLDCRGDKGGAGDGRGGGWGWGVVYQWPSSTPIFTTSPQAIRRTDAPTLNPAKTARASLESAFVYCSARRGRGDKRRGREEALIAQSLTCVGIKALGLRCVKSCWVAHRGMQPCLDCRGDKGGAGDGRGWGWGVVYQWPSYKP